MTQHPNRALHAHRRAIAVFLAATALPVTAYAQETVTPPTVVVPSQSAPVATPAPAPATQTPPGESRTRIAPGVVEAAEQEARERAAAGRAERAEARQQQPRAARPAPRAEAPARPAATPVPAPVTAPEPAAPVAAAPVTPAPTEVAPPPAETVAPVESSSPETTTETGSTMWLILAAIGLAVAAVAAFLLLRPRRRDEEVYETYPAEPAQVAVQPEPVTAPRIADPVAAAPIFVAPRREPEVERMAAPAAVSDEPQPALENPELVVPDAEDINAVLGGAKPQGERPQLELAMRPTRAGMSRRGAMVEFELTVANAGNMPAEDVRIGAFMLGDTAAAPSEIERLLMHPPAEQVVPAERIEPGDGTRLNAAVTLPRELVDAATHDGDEGFTPVLVADARYRLPDGREGRTAAAFTIGRINGGEHLVPIALHDDPAMYADIEARLHSVPAKV